MCNVPCNISLYYSGRAFLKSVGVFPLLSVDFGTGPSNCLGCWHISGPSPVAFNECCTGKASVSCPPRKDLMCCSCNLVCWSKQVDPAAWCLFTHASFEFTSAQEFVQRTWLFYTVLWQSCSTTDGDCDTVFWKLDPGKEQCILLSKGCFGASYHARSRGMS